MYRQCEVFVGRDYLSILRSLSIYILSSTVVIAIFIFIYLHPGANEKAVERTGLSQSVRNWRDNPRLIFVHLSCGALLDFRVLASD